MERTDCAEGAQVRVNQTQQLNLDMNYEYTKRTPSTLGSTALTQGRGRTAWMGRWSETTTPNSYPAEHSHCPAPAKALSCPATPGTPEEMPYLKVANHGEASSADPASGQPQGVEQGWPQALQEVGIAQQPHQDDCRTETQPCHLLLSAAPLIPHQPHAGTSPAAGTYP